MMLNDAGSMSRPVAQGFSAERPSNAGAISGVGARDVWCVLAADRLVDAH